MSDTTYRRVFKLIFKESTIHDEKLVRVTTACWWDGHVLLFEGSAWRRSRANYEWNETKEEDRLIECHSVLAMGPAVRLAVQLHDAFAKKKFTKDGEAQNVDDALAQRFTPPEDMRLQLGTFLTRWGDADVWRCTDGRSIFLLKEGDHWSRWPIRDFKDERIISLFRKKDPEPTRRFPPRWKQPLDTSQFLGRCDLYDVWSTPYGGDSCVIFDGKEETRFTAEDLRKMSFETSRMWLGRGCLKLLGLEVVP